MKIDVNEIKRKGHYISLGKGITAVEGREGNLPSLIIRKDGKIIKDYQGSSLMFSSELTEEDKRYLKGLAEK